MIVISHSPERTVTLCTLVNLYQGTPVDAALIGLELKRDPQDVWCDLLHLEVDGLVATNTQCAAVPLVRVIEVS